MWKDFFYFSKSERRAVLFLLTLLFVFICMWVLFPVKEEETLEQDQEGIEEIKNFLAGVHEMEERQSLQYSYDKPKKRKVVLAAFDPNSADSIDFLQRGLPPFIAHTILQYRRAGGKFRTADDFSRVYGLSSEEFKILKPYIRIGEVFRRKQDTLHAVKKMRKDTLAVYKYPEGTLVDLNEADTTELKKIPGIGSGIARMIVAYRNRLSRLDQWRTLRRLCSCFCYRSGRPIVPGPHRQHRNPGKNSRGSRLSQQLIESKIIR